MADQDKRAITVMVVEDEALAGLDLEFSLQQAGYEVLGPIATVTDAGAALDKGLPDIALLDVNLHGKTTYPLAERLLAAGVPVIFSTGYYALEDAPPALQKCQILQKPIRDEALFSTLAKVLDGRIPSGR